MRASPSDGVAGIIRARIVVVTFEPLITASDKVTSTKVRVTNIRDVTLGNVATGAKDAVDTGAFIPNERAVASAAENGGVDASSW